MKADQKARELVNIYYDNAKSQKEAIEICERIVLSTICKEIIDLDNCDMDLEGFILPSIQILKYWQEVVCELRNMKNKIPVM